MVCKRLTTSPYIHSWLYPLFRKGYKRNLDSNDLFQPLNVHRSHLLGDRLSEAWQRQIEQHKATGRKPSLLMATLSVFGVKIVALGLILFFVECLFQ